MELLLSIIITWGIGLTPPLLIRYAIIKKPLIKPLAIGACTVLFFANIITFTYLGSENKTHGVLLLVALVSYWILTRKKKDLSEFDYLKNHSNNPDSLTSASWAGDLAKVKLLISGGADVNQPNCKGHTALDLARARGDKQLVEFLISKGASSDAKNSHIESGSDG